MPLKFRFRWIPFIAALTVAVVGMLLGQWQTRRAAEKEAIEAKMSIRESAAPKRIGADEQSVDVLEYHRVVVRGEFIRDWTVYLDNRPYHGAAGFYVLTPMRVEGSNRHVLVMRGWGKRDTVDRTKLPSIATPPGLVEIEGIVRNRPGRVFQVGAPEPLRPAAIVQNVDIAAFSQAAKLQMQPFVIEQLTDIQDGLVRDWPRPSSGVEKHRGYAFQWYALAITALIFFVVTGFRRGQN